MKKLCLTFFICIIVLLIGNTQALQAITIDDFTTFGAATRNGGTINYSAAGPVGGFYASNILIPNNFKGVSFDFAGTNYTPSCDLYLFFKVFEGTQFNTGWNGDGAIFWAHAPAREYRWWGDGEPLGPPVTVSHSCYVDLARYQGETVSLGWVFVTDAGPAVASISNIDFYPVPEPSTMALMSIGLFGVTIMLKRLKNLINF